MTTKAQNDAAIAREQEHAKTTRYMRTPKLSFAHSLRAHRLRLNLTQAELAKLLSVSFEAVSKWERSLATPSAIAQEGALARLNGRFTK